MASAGATVTGRNGRIAFNGGQVIFTIRPDGSGIRQLTGTHRWNAWPNYAPDGRTIVYQHDNNVWIMNADGTDKHPVLRYDPCCATGGSTPNWAPDGRRLVLTATRGEEPSTDLFIKRLGVRGVRRVFHDVYTEHFPVWSPGGGRILFASDRRYDHASEGS